MALVASTKGDFQVPPPDPFEDPPAVIAPDAGDPWPRPYYLENGLRKVLPYHFTYNTYCKARWRDREILDIFASEFRDRPLEYYVYTPNPSSMPGV
jgi:tRNA pseudouridine synthase 9